MSFMQGNIIHGLGEYGASPAAKHCSRGIWGKSEFYRALEAATQTQELGDFPEG